MSAETKPSLLSRIAREVAGPLLSRDVEPLEGTRMSLWNSIIPNFWTENGLNGSNFWPGNGMLADKTWITNRCLQMNSQQIGSMPLRFEAPNVADSFEPAWVSNPDPLYYPNGLSSLIRALIRDYYGWGWCLLYVTSRYANGYPRTFTRVPACVCEPMWDDNGYRVYKRGDKYLDPDDIIQIDRDCGEGWAAHGSSAIRSYAQLAWGLQAAGNQAMSVNDGGVPQSVLKVVDANRKLDSTQAGDLKTQWDTARQGKTGPAVLPYGLDFTPLGWNPKDMALIETQEFNALALAAAFGVPAVLLNMAIKDGMTYQNPGMLGEMWWRFELRPTAKGFADALTSQALPSGQWVWFDATDTFLSIEPQNAQQTGLLATSEDDSEASAVAKDSQADSPPAAAASPAQRSQAHGLTVIGGNR